MARLIYANLDGESELKGHRTPPRRVIAALARWATLLRVLALSDDDEIRLPWFCDPPRIRDLPCLPRPRLTFGRVGQSDRGRPILPWLVTPELDGCGATERAVSSEGFHHLPLRELLWLVPPSPSAVVRTVSHRAFALAIAQQLHCALPGARALRSIAELWEHLEAREGMAWVVKSPHSAAGRQRWVHRGGRLRRAERRAVERLWARSGELLFEPWMERLDDFGCVAVAAGSEIRIAGLHRQRVDDRGRFGGIELQVDPFECEGLRDAERERLLSVTLEVGRALLAAGYRGAFGVDAWRYAGASGGERFHPLGEINARPSFGLIVRMIADQLSAGLGIGEGPVRLSWSSGELRLEADSLAILF